MSSAAVAKLIRDLDGMHDEQKAEYLVAARRVLSLDPAAWESVILQLPPLVVLKVHAQRKVDEQRDQGEALGSFLMFALQPLSCGTLLLHPRPGMKQHAASQRPCPQLLAAPSMCILELKQSVSAAWLLILLANGTWLLSFVLMHFACRDVGAALACKAEACTSSMRPKPRQCSCMKLNTLGCSAQPVWAASW